jgi:hypothetical protein
MADKKYIDHLKGDKPEFDEIKILVRDPDHQLIKFIKAIRGAANPGHSFPVVVDPDDSEYERKFYFDGDGSFYIKDIKFNGKEWEDKK